MRPSSTSLKAVRIPTPRRQIANYEIPSLSSISYQDLPNNGFGIKNYSIERTKFKHWPVYLKVQNTKITTEVKRIKGDIVQFKRDLLAFNPDLHITVNETYGYANIKGNVVDEIKQYFDQGIKTEI